MQIENFFWNTFCDHYLELVKDRIYGEHRSEEEKRSAHFTLYTVLLGTLKMFAPIMPHITERIYQLYFSEKENEKTIHKSMWPPVLSQYIFDEQASVGDAIVDLLGIVRKYKSEQQLSLGSEIEQAVIRVPKALRAQFELALADFSSTARIKDIEITDGDWGITF